MELRRGVQRLNPVGVDGVSRQHTQGSLALLRQKHFGGQATLGWRTQSRWDWRCAQTLRRGGIFSVRIVLDWSASRPLRGVIHVEIEIRFEVCAISVRWL